MHHCTNTFQGERRENWLGLMLCELQVLLAAEEALRRLQVTNEERNAILETLRYCDQKQQAQSSTAPDVESSDAAAKGPQSEQSAISRPFTQYAQIPFQ